MCGGHYRCGICGVSFAPAKAEYLDYIIRLQHSNDEKSLENIRAAFQSKTSINGVESIPGVLKGDVTTPLSERHLQYLKSGSEILHCCMGFLHHWHLLLTKEEKFSQICDEKIRSNCFNNAMTNYDWCYLFGLGKDTILPFVSSEKDNMRWLTGIMPRCTCIPLETLIVISLLWMCTYSNQSCWHWTDMGLQLEIFIFSCG